MLVDKNVIPRICSDRIIHNMINRYIISMQRVLCVVIPAFAYMLFDIDVPSVTLQHSVFVALVDYRISTPHISLCVPENGTKLEISILLTMLRIDKTILVVCILYTIASIMH